MRQIAMAIKQFEWPVTITIALFILFFSFWMKHLAAQERFRAGDGITVVDCLERTIKVADLYVHGRLPEPDSEQLPIIKDDLVKCLGQLDRLKTELKSRVVQ